MILIIFKKVKLQSKSNKAWFQLGWKIPRDRLSFMTHYADYFELQHSSISLHLVYLSFSLLLYLSLSLSHYLPVFIIPISFSIFLYAPQSKLPNKIKQEHT
jgi:hypothetical protein